MKYLAAGLGCIVWLASGCSGSGDVKSPSNGGTSGTSGSTVFAGAGGNGSAGARPTGGSCTSNADCAVGACSAGTCKEVSCVPNSTYCANGGITQCGADGTQQGVVQHCAAGQYCLEKAGTASCSATVCFANDAMCVGSVATQCLPDGSGPKPGGSDCAKSMQTCYAGQCRDLVCTPGQKLCDNNTLFLCAEDGTSRAPITVCGAGQVCDATQGACEVKVCDPGKMGCDSTRVVSCNAAGSGWNQTGTDCAAKQSICVAGGCLPTVCQSGRKYCKDNKVYACSFDGTSQVVSQTCDSTQHCTESDNYAYCDSDPCVPGQLSCNGNLLATCNADGTDWLPGGTDCALSNSICIGNQCKPTVCNAGELFCKNGNVQQCNDGQTYVQTQFCAQGTYCLSHGTTPDCAPTPCQPDTDACVAEKLGHCTTDGMSVTATADCGAQKLVCTLGGCIKSAVDTVTSGNQIGTGGSNELIGNVLLVQTARKLTLIEAPISVPVPRAMVWAVYEQTNSDLQGEFDLKFQKTSTATGTGFQSSGAISVQLEAGKTYFIGVSATDGSFAYYYDYVTGTPALNFAHVIGSVDTGFGPSFDYWNQQQAGMAYQQRLTTTTTQ
jgi:hypothetical protein